MTSQLVIIGPPGAGKGTQAAKLAERYGIVHIATGDMIREEIAKGTPLGRRVDELIAGGDFIGDDEMIVMVCDRLAKPDAAHGFILDGFPRDLAQARKFSETPDGKSLDAVIVLEVVEDEIVERLSGRLVCPTCGRSYQVKLDPPKDDTRCDLDGTLLVRRPDDTLAAVRHRLDVYRRVTAPLIDYYKERGLAITIDASAAPDKVFKDIERALDGLPKVRGAGPDFER